MEYQGKTFVAISTVTCACSLGNKVNIRGSHRFHQRGQDEHMLQVRGAATDTVLTFLLFIC